MTTHTTAAASQIRYLVVNLNKKNQKSSTSEIAHLQGMYGEGAFVYLIQCLVEEIDFRDTKLQKDQLKVQLLAQEFGKLACKPNFTQAVCQIFGAKVSRRVQRGSTHLVVRHDVMRKAGIRL